jgi:prevent-host-death family protein
MKKISQLVSLKQEIEHMSMSDLRANPGEVIESVRLGKTFIVSKAGRQIAVLSALPGSNLSIVVAADGSKSYSL